MLVLDNVLVMSTRLDFAKFQIRLENYTTSLILINLGSKLLWEITCVNTGLLIELFYLFIYVFLYKAIMINFPTLLRYTTNFTKQRAEE